MTEFWRALTLVTVLVAVSACGDDRSGDRPADSRGPGSGEKVEASEESCFTLDDLRAMAESDLGDISINEDHDVNNGAVLLECTFTSEGESFDFISVERRERGASQDVLDDWCVGDGDYRFMNDGAVQQDPGGGEFVTSGDNYEFTICDGEVEFRGFANVASPTSPSGFSGERLGDYVRSFMADTEWAGIVRAQELGVTAPADGADGALNDPLAFFRATESICAGHASRTGNPAVTSANFADAEVIEQVDEGSWLVRDGAGNDFVVKPSDNVVHGPGGPTDTLPLEYLYGCPPELYLGTSHD